MPQSIADYELGPVLGHGGLAVVYRAQCKRHAHAVALKVLREDLACEPAIVDRFRYEARLLHGWRHPRLLHCLAWGEDGGCYWQATEYYPHGDTQNLLRQQRGILDLETALQITIDITEALTVVHQHGVLHRDVKPGNMLLGADGRAVLSDFGLSWSTEHPAPAPGLPIGTPAYCSPEQIRGDPGLDQRSDIYSLAASLYRMLAGDLLWDDDDPQAVLSKVLAGTLPELDMVLGHLPRRLRRLLRCCLDVNPQRRPASAAELRDGLIACREQSIVCDPYSPPDLSQVSGDDLSNEQRRRLATLVQIDQQGLRARLRLAAGSSLRWSLLQAILHEAGVAYGLKSSAMIDTLRSAGHTREVICAEAQLSRPGQPGQNVYAEPLPATTATIALSLSDNGQQLLAHLLPGQAVLAADLQTAMATTGYGYSIAPTLLRHLLSQGIADAQTVTVATVPAPYPCQPWRGLSGKTLKMVNKGDELAIWQGGHSDQAWRSRNDGVMITGDSQPLAVAAKSGFCYQGYDGALWVRTVQQLASQQLQGIMTFSHSALLLIDGDIPDGVEVHTPGDVLVLGNICGGSVYCGGDLQVNGIITGGESTVYVGNELTAAAVHNALLVAMRVMIAGRLEYARVYTGEDLAARVIIGGEAMAQGSIKAAIVGNQWQPTTLLRCGHQLPKATLQHLHLLRTAGRQQRAGRLRERYADIDQELAVLRSRSRRLTRVPSHAQAHEQQLRDLLEWIEAQPLAAPPAAATPSLRITHQCWPGVQWTCGSKSWSQQQSLSGPIVSTATD